jgi:hypothetical protein
VVTGRRAAAWPEVDPGWRFGALCGESPSISTIMKLSGLWKRSAVSTKVS